MWDWSEEPEKRKSQAEEAKNQAPNLTPRSQQILAFARKEAEQLNHTYVGAEHLLLGLLRLDVSTSVKVLKSLGVDLDAARAEVKKTSPEGHAVPVGERIPYTPRVKTILHSAHAYAKRFQHLYVGTEHILLGLLAEEDRSLAGRILIQRFGLNLTEIRGAIEKELEKGLTTKEANPSTGQKF